MDRVSDDEGLGTSRLLNCVLGKQFPSKSIFTIVVFSWKKTTNEKPLLSKNILYS